ncbi:MULTISPECIES: hypothetical protein [Xanthomonas]|uniref:hypothetical protein n=1 Tax=Xanthomonas TaxID=338 RepID=UPI00096C7442|nr:hypothetical protein [Xanthomonas campestris]MCC5092096.1 hypothetical protein [Xanthomonas campestris pv. incanae]MEA9612997.1 hypothetical protein [Xanthomonas campestris pv. incanae]MEA9620569.1 hypothetical protein [Xanthomonas campestris pv. incanae]RFF45680.1 hypothetical protein D0A38_09305 [Xanthomonas campestris pv. incanae]WDJ09433.1 hypothetical protein JH299_17935 [Xanthomonas campestris pv. incanae]
MAAVDVVVANGAAAQPFALERAPAMRHLAAVDGGRALDVLLANDALPALEATDLTESDTAAQTAREGENTLPPAAADRALHAHVQLGALLIRRYRDSLR